MLMWLLVGMLFFGGAAVGPVHAEDAKKVEPLPIRLQLIWGTDSKSKSGRFEEVDPAIKERLNEFLKWQYYYEISNKQVKLEDDKLQSVQMSKKCEIRIRRIENRTVEVQLYGENKLIIKKRAKISARKPQCVAGRNEVNADFWGVLISLDDGSVKEAKAGAEAEKKDASAEKAATPPAPPAPTEAK